MPNETEVLRKLVETLTKKLETLNNDIAELKRARSQTPVITSKLSEEDRKQHELSSPGMQRAIDKVLLDWERLNRD